jgi:hypothetical protein
VGDPSYFIKKRQNFYDKIIKVLEKSILFIDFMFSRNRQLVNDKPMVRFIFDNIRLNNTNRRFNNIKVNEHLLLC